MYRAGIDLGGTNIKAAILDEQNQILAEGSIPTKVQRPYTEIIEDMAGIVKKLMKELSITEDQLTGVGIGSPGTIDAEAGIVAYSNNFGWENVSLVDEMKKYIPVISVSPMMPIVRHWER